MDGQGLRLPGPKVAGRVTLGLVEVAPDMWVGIVSREPQGSPRLSRVHLDERSLECKRREATEGARRPGEKG